MSKQFLVKFLLASLVVAMPSMRADFKQDAKENAAYVAKGLLKAGKTGGTKAWYATRVVAGSAGIIVGSALVMRGLFQMLLIHNKPFRLQISKEMYELDFVQNPQVYKDFAEQPIFWTACSAAVIACATALSYVSYKKVLPPSDTCADETTYTVVLAPVETITDVAN